MIPEGSYASVREFGKNAMWEVVVLVLQIAGLAVLVAAAIVSVAAPGWVKRRFKGPHWG